MAVLAKLLYGLAIVWAVGMVSLLIGVILIAPGVGEGIKRAVEIVTNPLVLVYFMPSFLFYSAGGWAKKKITRVGNKKTMHPMITGGGEVQRRYQHGKHSNAGAGENLRNATAFVAFAAIIAVFFKTIGVVGDWLDRNPWYVNLAIFLGAGWLGIKISDALSARKGNKKGQ